MSADSTRPNIGVISDCALQRHVLQNALSAYGLNVILSCEPERIEDQQTDRVNLVNCWILELDNEEFESEALDRLIEQEVTPVLFGLGKAPPKHDERYISWERRLFGKLEEHLGQMEVLESEDSLLALDQQTQSKPIYDLDKGAGQILDRASPDQPIDELDRKLADEVWVLAASLGGPAAVKAFIDLLPASINAGFLYAQHVDAHFSNVLTKVLGRHSNLELKPLQNNCQVHQGEVLVVPVDNEVKFDQTGAKVIDNPWDGPYGPSIDHLLKNLVDHYGARCHVIVFSGMGNDGALLAPRMKQKGCSIWTQSPESCANGSMPQSIIDLECSEFTATPEELAQALIKRVGYSQQYEPGQEIVESSNRGI